MANNKRCTCGGTITKQERKTENNKIKYERCDGCAYWKHIIERRGKR
jgi:hypothetical protein